MLMASKQKNEKNALARLPILSAGRDRDQIILDHYLKGGEFSCTVAKRFPFYFFIPSDCYRYGANKDVVPMILPNRHPAPEIATHFLILLHFYSRTADFAFRVHSGKPQSHYFYEIFMQGLEIGHFCCDGQPRRRHYLNPSIWFYNPPCKPL